MPEGATYSALADVDPGMGPPDLEAFAGDRWSTRPGPAPPWSSATAQCGPAWPRGLYDLLAAASTSSGVAQGWEHSLRESASAEIQAAFVSVWRIGWEFALGSRPKCRSWWLASRTYCGSWVILCRTRRSILGAGCCPSRFSGCEY